MNSSSEDVSNETFDNSRNQAGSKVTTAVQTGSSYVDSGGSKSVDDQSSLSGGGAGRSDVTDRKSIKKMTLIKNLLSHIMFLPIFFLLTTLTLKTSNFYLWGRMKKL